MSSTPALSRILVAVDGSPQADAAIEWAARESALRRAPVTLMHVIPPIVLSWPIETAAINVPQWYDEVARDILIRAKEKFLGALSTTAAVEVDTEIVHSPVVPVLVDASKDAQLIVVGSRGLGAVGRMVLGSVSTGLVHRSHCPVAVVHSKTDDLPAADAPVLLGVDGSPASEAATAFAFDEASRRGVGLIALHAFSDVALYPMVGTNWTEFENEGGEVLSERLAGWQERYPDVNVERLVVCDSPGRWLVDGSAGAQLVVVGSHGRGGFAGMLLGSVSSAVAQSAQVPVVVVRNG